MLNEAKTAMTTEVTANILAFKHCMVMVYPPAVMELMDAMELATQP